MHPRIEQPKGYALREANRAWHFWTNVQQFRRIKDHDELCALIERLRAEKSDKLQAAAYVRTMREERFADYADRIAEESRETDVRDLEQDYKELGLVPEGGQAEDAVREG